MKVGQLPGYVTHATARYTKHCKLIRAYII